MEKLFFVFFSILTFNNPKSSINGTLNQMAQSVNEQQEDGPYVQYKGRQAFVNYIVETNGRKTVKKDSITLQQKSGLWLNVMTDMPGRSFRVQLKKNLKNEKSKFPKVKRLLVLSDIEGNFEAFRKLLQANKVIDENFNWTFGEGHLVLVGDFFDRGQQVTEVLWLIYYLEEKAKASGGYVHFILGNHEIMNLGGDLRYTPKKYLDNAALLNEDYVNLYDKNSELGRWLRTKNIVEKIGDILFTHGGISAGINAMNLTIPEINQLARPHYADTILDDSDERLEVLMGDPGPFWYRGYYDKTLAGIPLDIDNTLSQQEVNHIVTGHTITGDTVSVWYNGKLLNIDVPHAEGKSEALLIDNDKYYRVNAKGEKVLLTGP